MANTPESIDMIFKAPDYVSEVQGELMYYDSPNRATRTYNSYVLGDYVSYLKENISSFKQDIEQLAPAIQSPVLNILKGTREHKVLDARLNDFIESLERGRSGKAGKATNPGPKED